MVILVFNTHTKLMIPRHGTLLLDAQNTQDHVLALHWTRDMPRASQHFVRRRKPTVVGGPTSVRRSSTSSLAPSAHATRHAHARACHSSHAAARELLSDMRGSPGGEEVDAQEAARILWQQTTHLSRARFPGQDRRGQPRTRDRAAHLDERSLKKHAPARRCHVLACPGPSR